MGFRLLFKVHTFLFSFFSHEIHPGLISRIPDGEGGTCFQKCFNDGGRILPRAAAFICQFKCVLHYEIIRNTGFTWTV